MIIRHALIDNAWHRAAVMWGAALLINCVAWPSLDHFNIVVPSLFWLALALPIGTLLLLAIGKFHDPRRVHVFVSIIGIFGVMPIAFGLLLPLMALVLFEKELTTWMIMLVAAYAVLPAYQVFRGWNSLRQRVAKSRYFDREIKVGESVIYLNRSPNIDLDTDNAFPGAAQKIGDWVVPKLLFLLPAAYLLQRQIQHDGGTPAVLLLLAALCTPLAIHAATRTVDGIYLWIYRVSLIERKSGKKVVLAA